MNTKNQKKFNKVLEQLKSGENTQTFQQHLRFLTFINKKAKAGHFKYNISIYKGRLNYEIPFEKMNFWDNCGKKNPKQWEEMRKFFNDDPKLIKEFFKIYE